MKLLVIVLLVVGVTLVLNGYYRSTMACPPARIVYKYIPRTLAEEELNPVKVTDVFQTMFQSETAQPGPLGI